jgi:hypothetical protein
VDGPAALGGLVILVVLFLILRGFVLWYWRLNEVVTLLSSIDRHLSFISSRFEPADATQDEDETLSELEPS